MVGFLLLLGVVAGISWYLVFNERVRQKFAQFGWSFYRRTKEDREVADAFNLATSLIIAVTCSTLLVAVIIVALVKLFK